MMRYLWRVQESLRVMPCLLSFLTIARRNFGHSINFSLSCFISLPFITQRYRSNNVVVPPSFLSLDKLQTRANSTAPYHHQPKQKYHVTDFHLKPEEEVYAQEIRRVILKVHNGTVEDVIHSLKSNQFCSGSQIASQLVDSLLQNFGDDWKSALGFFEWVRLQFDYKHTSYACNKMVDLLGKMKQIDRMWNLVHDMHREGTVTLETIAKIMRRLAGARRWKDAITLFDELETMGFERDTESMNLLLDTLCKEKKVVVAHEAYQVIKDHIPPDAYTFNIFVHGWCSARRIDEAMWTIQEMRGRGFRPSVITYSTVLQAYCNQGNFQKVYELLDLMASEGCPPNVVTYTTIMNTLAKSGNLDEALLITQRMKSSGCKSDTLFYNSLINILGRAGQLHEASQIFEVEMQMTGVARNISTFNTMISIFSYHGQEQSALDVLKEMDRSSCKPDLQTYRPLLRLCFCKRELNNQLRSLLNDIVYKHNLSLDLDTYTLLIHGLCKIGELDWALSLFDEMIGREIFPRPQTCELLMDEAERKNMEATVDKIQTTMKGKIWSFPVFVY